MKKKLNILITGIGGPTPRSIAKSLRKHHENIQLIGIDVNPKALGFYMSGLVDKSYLAPPVKSTKEYWSFIEELIVSETIDLAFVQPELEVIEWGNYFVKYKRFPCPTLIPPVDLAKALMDKSIMADILEGTYFIPKTIKVTQENPRFNEVLEKIGFPCWIRATKGSGGLGSLKLDNIENYKSWLFINREINEFTVSEFLTGRHLATQQLYYNGKCLNGASLECVEYVMASIAPSKVTGNTSFGRFLNEDTILSFCDECVTYICKKLNQTPHGVLSFDLKEDSEGNLKVTEINIRHMAYTGVMAEVGFDLCTDTIELLTQKDANKINKVQYFHYDKPYIFLRDVDIEPIILEGEHELKSATIRS